MMDEQRARAIVYERSAGFCELDGENLATDWAHRRAEGQGGLWTPENGLHLCRACHEWTEHNPVLAADGGWRLVHDNRPPGEVAVWLSPRLAWPGWWHLDDRGTYYPLDFDPVPELPPWVTVPA